MAWQSNAAACRGHCTAQTDKTHPGNTPRQHTDNTDKTHNNTQQHQQNSRPLARRHADAGRRLFHRPRVRPLPARPDWVRPCDFCRRQSGGWQRQCWQQRQRRWQRPFKGRGRLGPAPLRAAPARGADGRARRRGGGPRRRRPRDDAGDVLCHRGAGGGSPRVGHADGVAHAAAEQR